MTYFKLIVAVLVAFTALVVSVGTAAATRLSLSNRSIRVVWSSFEYVTGGEAGPTIRCRVTLEGSFHESTISKVEASLIGYITAAQVRRPCTGGTAWFYNGSESNEVLTGTFTTSLPWHITYEGFNGALPTPSAIRMLLILGRIMARGTFLGLFRLLCAYRSSSSQNITITYNLGAGGGVTNPQISSAELTSESRGGCPRGRIRSPAGDGTLSTLGTINAVSITLV